MQPGKQTRMTTAPCEFWYKSLSGMFNAMIVSKFQHHSCILNACSFSLLYSACTKIAENLEEEKRYLYASSLDSRHTLGFTLDLYHRYCIQAKV